MMDIDPAKWKSTKLIRGYTYAMQHDQMLTLDKLTGIPCRIVERRFYHQPSMWHNKRVWGWIKFKEPLHLWDAMEAGLVPVFRQEVRQ